MPNGTLIVFNGCELYIYSIYVNIQNLQGFSPLVKLLRNLQRLYFLPLTSITSPSLASKIGPAPKIAQSVLEYFAGDSIHF